MFQLELRRDIRDQHVTMGVLWCNGRTFYTIESTWRQNTHGGRGGDKHESCVAPGAYRLVQHVTPSGERVWMLSNPMLDVYTLPDDVPQHRLLSCRYGIMLRSGQYWHDIGGGIAPGKHRMKRAGVWMVEETRSAMNELRLLLQGKLDVSLTITEAL